MVFAGARFVELDVPSGEWIGMALGADSALLVVAFVYTRYDIGYSED